MNLNLSLIKQKLNDKSQLEEEGAVEKKIGLALFKLFSQLVVLWI